MSEELKPGMHKCIVCNRVFELRKENRYTAEAKKAAGLLMLATGTDFELYDAVDCPYCGCQQILHARERAFVENNFDEERRMQSNILCEKCQECVNKDKYQDEEPCCDCDPQGEAEGFEPLKKCGDYSNFASKKNKEQASGEDK